MYIAFLVSFTGVILLFQKSNRFKKVRFILWPVKDAFTNNCDVTPALILQKLSSGRKNDLTRFFHPSFKDLKSPATFQTANPAIRNLKSA
jgi:hypothetical protein